MVHVTQGYSRDHRQDLNQVVAKFICKNESGIPLLMKALGGNSSDRADFRRTVAAHVGQLRANEGLEYLVSDSALYTKDTTGGFGWTRPPYAVGYACHHALKRLPNSTPRVR